MVKNDEKKSVPYRTKKQNPFRVNIYFFYKKKCRIQNPSKKKGKKIKKTFSDFEIPFFRFFYFSKNVSKILKTFSKRRKVQKSIPN